MEVVIFSKDRAMQLDLLLRSIHDNAAEIKSIYILYKATTPAFKKAYNKLKEYHKHSLIKEWIEEVDFFRDFLRLIQRYHNYYFLALADDDVVIRPKCLDIITKRIENKVACASLRLHIGIKYCYTQNIYISLPEFIEKNVIIRWDWTKVDRRSEWGYPCNITGQIMKTSDLMSIINGRLFKAPNSLEGVLSYHRKKFAPEMIAYTEAMVVNVPINQVQTEVNLKAGRKIRYDIGDLNYKFLQGERIDPIPLYNTVSDSVHTELEYTFVK
jgi:hypothetical protein